MKKKWRVILLCSFVAACSDVNKAPGDFKTAKETMEEERKGSIFGKDALSWKWSKDNNEAVAEEGDPLWLATSRVMSGYPISFTNYHARLIQTGWITSQENPGIRYRFTVRLLGKPPVPHNLDVLMMMEKKHENTWTATLPDPLLRKTLIDNIVMEATRIYDQNKRD